MKKLIVMQNTKEAQATISQNNSSAHKKSMLSKKVNKNKSYYHEKITKHKQ